MESLVLVGWEACKEEGLAGEEGGKLVEVSL